MPEVNRGPGGSGAGMAAQMKGNKMTKLKELQNRMAKQFQGAETDSVDGVLVVHLDKPEKKQRAARIKEALAGGPMDDNCPQCRALRASRARPAVVVYDADAVLCFGADDQGPYASGFPRKPVKDGTLERIAEEATPEQD